MWLQLGLAGLGALQGYNSAQRKAEQQKQYNLAQAETSRYSPWTKMQGQLDSSYSPSAMDGAFSGGVTGLGMGQSLSNAFADKPAAAPQSPQMDQQQQSIYNGIAPQQQPREAFQKTPWTFFGSDPSRRG
jgi:uncharacterized phage infection (PIP) family protein YhgE